MRVYLCAAWRRQALMRSYREILRDALDVEVTSRWLDCTGDPVIDPEAQRIAAAMDLADLELADQVIALTETPDVGYMTGGRHVEVGYALALGKTVHVIGAPENVFHFHPLVRQWPSFGKLVTHYALTLGEVPRPLEPVS